MSLLIYPLSTLFRQLSDLRARVNGPFGAFEVVANESSVVTFGAGDLGRMVNDEAVVVMTWCRFVGILHSGSGSFQYSALISDDRSGFWEWFLEWFLEPVPVGSYLAQFNALMMSLRNRIFDWKTRKLRIDKGPGISSSPMTWNIAPWWDDDQCWCREQDFVFFLAAFRLHPSDFSFLETERHVIDSKNTSLNYLFFNVFWWPSDIWILKKSSLSFRFTNIRADIIFTCIFNKWLKTCKIILVVWHIIWRRSFCIYMLTRIRDSTSPSSSIFSSPKSSASAREDSEDSICIFFPPYHKAPHPHQNSEWLSEKPTKALTSLVLVVSSSSLRYPASGWRIWSQFRRLWPTFLQNRHSVTRADSFSFFLLLPLLGMAWFSVIEGARQSGVGWTSSMRKRGTYVCGHYVWD